MLSKLFKRKSLPDNNGKPASEPTSVTKFTYVKAYWLELSNMEGSPTYALKHQLSIGSEIGNIIIADQSVSPRHASFILQQDVISVIDHGSVAGTFVNGKKIPPGKFIILEETDVVAVGNLEVRPKLTTEAEPLAPVAEEGPEEMTEVFVSPFQESAGLSAVIPKDIPDEMEIEVEVDEEIQEEDLEEEDEDEEDMTPKKSSQPKLHIVPLPKHSANSIIRLVAVISDLLLAYSVLVIFMPFDEFRNFLGFIPDTIGELLAIDWKAFWTSLGTEGDFIGLMAKDVYLFLSETFHVGPLFLMFLLIRLISTLVLGVSLSEFLLNLRPQGGNLWSRIGGALRVLIGAITGPFLIFDIPAVISRRTFKEVITFTNVQMVSKLPAFLGTILLLPLMLGVALLSPLLEGLEPPEPVGIQEQVEQRVKARVAEGGPADATNLRIEDQSEKLNVKLEYDSSELVVVPNFKFQGLKSKLNVKSSLIFYQKDSSRQVEMEILKTFDFRELLGLGIRGNVPLYEKYPQVYNFVYESQDSNPAFRSHNDLATNNAFANEFMQFTKVAFSLGMENVFQVMQEETFLIKGMINYKKSFLELIEYKDFDEINFLKIGNAFFMRIHFKKQKPFDLLIPLVKGEGRILKISFDKLENSESVASKFYKFNLHKTDWLAENNPQNKEILSALNVFDLFSTPGFKTQLLSEQKSQALYAYYFETSVEILRQGDAGAIELWKSKIKSLLTLIESIPAPKDENQSENAHLPVEKLVDNFRDLVDAVENNNLEYLGIQTSTTI